MKNHTLSLSALFLATSMIACNKQDFNKPISLTNDKAKVSYVIGQQIGSNLKSQNVDIDVQVMGASIKDVLDGKESRMTKEEMNDAIMKMRQAMVAKQEKAAIENKVQGEAFLKENKAKDGVTVTASGLQYEVLTKGKGNSPKATDTVSVHYKGTLIDGSEFDSSYKRKAPAQFPVNGVIKGWTEALQLMKPGSKWKLYIPSELAYGATSRPQIPGHSVLIFEVELLEIIK